MSVARFRIEECSFIDDNTLLIKNSQYHHLFRVKRVKKGGVIEGLENSGKIYRCRVKEISKKDAVCEVLEVLSYKKCHYYKIVFFLPLLKRSSLELVVQKLTEIGVDVIIPVITQRTVYKPKGDITSKLLKVAIETTKQCGVPIYPDIKQPLFLEKAVGGILNHDSFINGLKVVFCSLSEAQVLGVPFYLETILKEKLFDVDSYPITVYIFVGPEGGWEKKELRMLFDCGIKPAILYADTLLKSETACIISCAIIKHLLEAHFLKEDKDE